MKIVLTKSGTRYFWAALRRSQVIRFLSRLLLYKKWTRDSNAAAGVSVISISPEFASSIDLLSNIFLKTSLLQHKTILWQLNTFPSQINLTSLHSPFIRSVPNFLANPSPAGSSLFFGKRLKVTAKVRVFSTLLFSTSPTMLKKSLRSFLVKSNNEESNPDGFDWK